MTTDSARSGLLPRPGWLSLFALVVTVGGFLFAGLSVSLAPAFAANVSVNQCNDVNGGPLGATTGITCAVTVVNTINGGVTSSTVTLTRQCSLEPCQPGNGTFTTTSPDLVTDVTQCNGSGNDAAPPLITCTVTVTNNISADTPGAGPVTAATVNQCVGTATSGGPYGGHALEECNPASASTTGATVTQCNGSVTGGGSTAVCAVGTASSVSPMIPIRVNQCNGTGNKGGTLLTCETTITTNITPVVSTPTATAAVTPAPSGTATPGGTTAPTGSATPTATAQPTGTATAAGPRQPPTSGSAIVRTPQISRVPSGGVPAGGGSSGEGPGQPRLLMLGAALLLAATGTASLGWRAGRR